VGKEVKQKNLLMRIRNDWITDLYHKEMRERQFYKENGKLIMTEEYLINRGYCCGSGCRHCPYWPPHQQQNTNLRDNV